ncbi:uncharacterized protein LOC103312993 isoform X2 [Tribolium castaneum]|uniref:Uncharacterized protein n=1 Tax=Tribolium castaneum TaxID=7070 RepID=D6WKF3_TRICA|nr:PREDICTED: uncharacterized protein LOC103312993 isoform X2 [Tribolium castaneum]EFA03984.2 hypothetical protein TcasGA2_TC014133 [Tribolium castaneum]|eukprot:XP_008193297.1 PREDICTED: uncharacterized protein LOC103312993 isoform X2 [Tribolium castaneum]
MVLFTEKGGPKIKHTEAAKKKIASRRGTRVVLPSDPRFSKLRKQKVKLFTAAQKWWSKASIKYAFSHPHVTSRLEKLMGSNLVSLTDRDYMQKLQERILEDYAESMDKRIKVRENEEMERVKNLVLSGRIPLHEAPESMADHPIMMIERHCKKLIAARRAKIKIPKVHIPTHLYSDDTPDPPSGLSIENGHIFRKPYEKLCNPVSRFLPVEEFPFYDFDDSDEEEEEEDEGEGEIDTTVQKIVGGEAAPGGEGVEEEEEVTDAYMFTRAEYDRLKYESPLIKQLRRCQIVEELYALADEIIGILKTLEPESAAVRTTSEDTLFSVTTSTATQEKGSDRRSSQGSQRSQAVSH